MARYIDADKLCNGLKGMAIVLLPYKQSTILGVVSTIENMPTADVVPKSEVERLQIEIEALKIANEKMYIANKETEAEVVKEIISIIEQRDESNDEHACGVKSEILSALYRGRKDAYRDIKEILEQKCGVHTNNGVHTNKGRCRHTICPEARHEVAMEIFEEIEKLHLHITNEFDLRRYEELKKKYTEGK